MTADTWTYTFKSIDPDENRISIETKETDPEKYDQIIEKILSKKRVYFTLFINQNPKLNIF